VHCLWTWCLQRPGEDGGSLGAEVTDGRELLGGCWELNGGFFGGGVRDRVSLYSSGCPGTHFVDQAGLKLRNLPASGIKGMCHAWPLNGGLIRGSHTVLTS
jgi:hypothetical protein